MTMSASITLALVGFCTAQQPQGQIGSNQTTQAEYQLAQYEKGSNLLQKGKKREDIVEAVALLRQVLHRADVLQAHFEITGGKNCPRTARDCGMVPRRECSS